MNHWTPAVGDFVADRRTGSTARVVAIGNRPARVHHDNPTVTLEWTHRAGWSRRSTTRMLPLRRTYRPAPEETPMTIPPPGEPGPGSAVRDRNGEIWAFTDGRWRVAGSIGYLTWPELLAAGAPLTLLIDGPVIP